MLLPFSFTLSLRARARFFAGVVLSAFAILPVLGQSEPFEQAPIHYSETEARDPVSTWQERLNENSLQFDQRSESAFVESVLAELDVPVASQVMVYSKTSLQIDAISPRRPPRSISPKRPTSDGSRVAISKSSPWTPSSDPSSTG